MRRYDNLPSINVEILDGNLRVDRTITGPVVLIIGTATDGPNEAQYLVSDSNQAASVFGPDSAIIKRLGEVKLGGARNVILYRIGGVSASIKGLFGPDSEITAIEKNVASNTKYKIYAGPNPDGVTPGSVLIIFATESNITDEENQIVYSNVPGGEVDFGLFEIIGFDDQFQGQIGTPTQPVAFNVAHLNVSEAQSETVLGEEILDTYNDTGDGLITTYQFVPSVPNGYVAVVTGATVNGVPATGTQGAGANANEFTFDTPPPNTESVAIDFSLHKTTFEFQNPFVAGSVVNEVTVNSTAVSNWVQVDGEVVFDVAPADSDSIEISFTVPTPVVGAEYTPGSDGRSATWKQYYEMVDRAYLELETTLATHVFVDRAILDAPNIADGATGDALEYLRYTESDGQRNYHWKQVKTEYQYSGSLEDATHSASNNWTTVLVDADTDINGQPIVKYTYSEVNFAHQLGAWCHGITINERFVLGFIGTSMPESTSVRHVARWIGSLPVTNNEGQIVQNGVGLLGNKFMAGSTTRRRGFYLTSSGLTDGGVITDSNGAVIDLGKFVSVVSGVLVTPNSGSIGTRVALTNGAAIYAALASQVSPGNSTTNTPVPGVSLPFITKKIKLDELTFANYVTFVDTPTGVNIVSGSLATGPSSDFKYISTIIIVNSIVTAVRARLQPYLGRGINQALLEAANTAVEGVLADAAEAGAIVRYQFAVLPGDTVYKLRVPIKIVPVFELREIFVPISLAYNI